MIGLLPSNPAFECKRLLSGDIQTVADREVITISAPAIPARGDPEDVLSPRIVS